MITIFKGDDTGGVFGRRVLLTIESEVALDGCSCDFVLHGVVKHVAAPIEPGSTHEIVYTHGETAEMPLGVARAAVVIIDADGRRSTVSNTQRVLVTDVVSDIQQESSASVTVQSLDIDDIAGLAAALEGKQKKLTAGANITITEDGVISARGGGGGGSVVESATNPGYAANADHAGSADSANSANSSAYATEAQSAYQAVQAVSAETVPWSGVTDTPTTVEGYGIEDAATKDQLRVTMQLVGNDPYTIQLDGVVQTFAQVKALAETRNAVIRHGQGTYRVTYIGASEMMWDVTGTVAGNVQTGQIHIFLQDGQTVVQRVEPKVLATKPIVDSVSAMAAYPMEIIVGGAVKDRTVNVCYGGGVISFPGIRSDECVRDFVVRVPAMDTAPTVVFPSDVRYESWQDVGDIWTAEAGKANEWYFSEAEPGIFKVVHQALAVVAQ